MINVPYARKVLEHLIAHPEEHDQGYFGFRTSCGTSACIAGTAVLMDPESTVTWSPAVAVGAAGRAKQMTSVLVNGVSTDVEPRAAELLGLDFFQTNKLFYNFDDADALKLLASYIERAE